MKVKAISVSVYKCNLRDCTNGGVSGKYSDLYILVDDEMDTNHYYNTYDLEENDPRLLKLVRRELWGEKHWYLEPINDPNKKEIAYMFGGNFAYTSDSRFPFDYPLPIHDRSETQKDYDALCR